MSVMQSDNRNSGTTKLISAAKTGHVRGVTAALRAGEDKEAVDPEWHNFRALHWSVNNGHRNVVVKLLDIGVNADARDLKKRSALHLCCLNGHERIGLLLIKKGVLIDTTDEDHCTPLMTACMNGYENLVVWLLNAGADMGFKNINGHTALHCASARGKNSVVNVLAQYGAEIIIRDKKMGREFIFDAAFGGHDLTVATLIQLGAEVNCMNNEGNTPLHAASQEGHVEVVKLLLENKAQVDYKNSTEGTSLVFASQNGHAAVGQILIEHGADVNTTDSEGVTALYLASKNGHVAVVQMLITHGADVNAADHNGYTPLIAASQFGRDEVVSLLIANGANIDALNIDDKSSLLLACHYGHIGTANILIQKSADLNRKTKNDSSPLHAASFKGYVDIVRALLQNGAQKNVTNNGWVATHIAAKQGHLDVLITLKGFGCDLNAIKKHIQTTPLHLAVKYNHTKVVKWLIVNGANPYVCNKKGTSPIQLALKKGEPELASFMTSKNIYSTSSSGSIQPTSSEAINLQCAVCLDQRTSTVMTLPCRHAKTCQKCSDELAANGDNRCPICRTEITQYIPIYL